VDAKLDTRATSSAPPLMRITGGVHRSRLLHAPKGVSTRPTSDRVREALFSILASRRPLSGANVLDLYAGTGALGLEALSRGAARVTFVECSRTALAALRANMETLGVEAEVHVISGLVERSNAALVAHVPFDLVLADPPYALVKNGEALTALGELVQRGILAAGGLVVLEQGKGEAAESVGGLGRVDARTYGDTLLAFYGDAMA
jgi:16S rRNA (guanine966-N2)-methyltransferase